MDVTSDFPLVGVGSAPPALDGHELTLRLGSQEDVRGTFPADAERIAELLFDDGSVAVSIDAAGEEGYLAHAFDFGHARVAANGRSTVIAPVPGEPSWVWQRYLTGQLLPLAAVLQGREVFHACVMGLGPTAIAVFAHSGVGKTTTALHLLMAGLEFMSDDVLVVEPAADRVIAHPGVGLANLRPGAEQLLTRLEQAGLATPIGTRPGETRLSIRRSDGARPLSAMFVLDRFKDDRPLAIERLQPVDPRLLIGATFNFSIRTPERLARQLDVCARVDRSVAVLRVTCGLSTPAYDVAEAILEHTRAAEPC